MCRRRRGSAFRLVEPAAPQQRHQWQEKETACGGGAGCAQRRRPRPRDLNYASRGFGSLTANADPSSEARSAGHRGFGRQSGYRAPWLWPAGKLPVRTECARACRRAAAEGQPPAAVFSHRKTQLLHRWAGDNAAMAAAAAAAAAATAHAPAAGTIKSASSHPHHAI